MDERAEAYRRIIGNYCERAGYPDFWAEPVNAITNLAFIIAALIAGRLALREGRVDVPVAFLTTNLVVIGIGSFLFHTFSTRWAAATDSIPIMIFIVAYLFSAMLRFVGLVWWQAILATVVAMVAMSGLASLFYATLRPVIGGSVAYLPALLLLPAVGSILAIKRHPAAPWLFVAGAVFTVSLTFRALDQPLCPQWPLGTHFMWHVLNGVVLGTLLVALVRHGRSAETRGAPA
ncbi:MAG: ceramidase domain-containing protein [Pseudomonadota bacterium]